MAQYIFKCRSCGANEVINQSIHKDVPSPAVCGSHGPMTRDYKAESVGLSGVAAMKQERDPSFNPYDFLPTPKDFLKKAGGNERKAARLQKNWNEEHTPRGHNSDRFRPGFGVNQ